MASNSNSIDIPVDGDEYEERSEDTQDTFDPDRSDSNDDDDGDGDGSDDDDDDEMVGDFEESQDDIEAGAEIVQGQDLNRTHDVVRSNRVHATPTLPSMTSKLVREIGGGSTLPGDVYTIWTVSSAKVGCGVAQLRDSSPDSYWQSDGTQPHYINIQFSKRVAVSEIALYLDYSLDESYTPKKISIKSGMTFHDLQEIKTAEFNEPKGWCAVELVDTYGSDPLDLLYDDMDDENGKNKTNNRKMFSRPIRTNLLQISVLSMHQNGKDTHIRQVKVFGPKMNTVQSFKPTMGLSKSNNIAASESFSLHESLNFQSAEMAQFSFIR